MGSRQKPKPYKIGPFSMSGGSLQGNAWKDISLEHLPDRWEFGVGMCVMLEFYLQATVGTLANDPALDAYKLQRLMDWQLIGQDSNQVIADRKGYHDPVREALKFGKFDRTLCADLPATGAGGPGSYARTFVKRIDFREPRMRDSAWRCLPSSWLKKGKLRIFPYSVAQAVGGASPKLNDLTLTIYAWIVDVPLKTVPIGSLVKEHALSVPTTPTPSPGPGTFLRTAVALDPATAGTADDVSSITTISYGEPAGGYLHLDRDVSELVESWNAEQARDLKPTTIGLTLANIQEYVRFLDPLQNKSGHLHALPLVWPHAGDGLERLPTWAAKPTLKINNGNVAGVPAAVDFLVDEVVAREDGMVVKILDAIGEGMSRQGLSSRFKGQRAHLAPSYESIAIPGMAPLIFDLS